MACDHKFIHRDNDSFYRENGRYSFIYTLINYYFCKKCLEEKEIKKEISVSQGEELPDWAKSITQKIRSYV